MPKAAGMVSKTSLADETTVQSSPNDFTYTLVIGLIAFLTLVDLFATQAILPLLTQAYGVTPAAMGLAVNSTTAGMAIASSGVAFFSRAIDRRRGIFLSLTLLAIPTSLLAFAPNLAVFAALRIIQGLCMACAFTLTLAYLGEHCSARATAGAFAAYITGNVASNLFGRLMAAALADQFGLATNFFVFAGLNLAGAALVYFTIDRARSMEAVAAHPLSAINVLAMHLGNKALRASFGIGFCILFAFIGTFTYVNFVLVRPPIAIGMMALGFAYFVFAPSIFTTLLAGRAVSRFGTRRTMWGALAFAGLGLPLTLVPTLGAVIAGMICIAVGTFFAQAIATGFTGRAATADRGAASGIYLTFYFCGGLAGTAMLGWLFDRFGWIACATGVGLALAVAALLTSRLKIDAKT
ncbi:MAG TPA: MFS transporter [Beijerinckia sp.]|jgi:predicted MFS family arabinose efflux permease|nr:MFS transporter [Beijerinckia sp.]